MPGRRPALRPSRISGGIAGTVLALLWLVPPPASALDGKLGLHFVRMAPNGQETERYSRAGWGFGVQLTVPMRGARSPLAGVAGIEYVNLLDQSLLIYDSQAVSISELRTDQYLGRFYLGPEIGAHGRGAFRPHAGANVALVLYGISSSLVASGGAPGQQAYENAYGEHKATFGYDVSAGLDINPWNTVSFDLGARYVKMFDVPKQLGFGAAPVHPAYVQGYVAVAFSLAWLRRGAGR